MKRSRYCFLKGDLNESRPSRRIAGGGDRSACGEEKIGNSKVNRGNSKTDESWDTRGILNSTAINYIKIQQVLACESTGYIVGLLLRWDSCGFFYTWSLETFARRFGFLGFLTDDR